MDYTISIPNSDHYLVIKMNKPVTRALAARAAKEAAILGVERYGGKPLGYLVDSRGMPNVDTYFENYEFVAVDIQRPTIDNTGPTAVIASPDDDSHDYVETAMQHMGVPFRVFKDERQAIKWIVETVTQQREQQAGG